MSDVPEQQLDIAAFGELLVAETTPIQQILAVNGLSNKTVEITNLSGTAVAIDGEFTCSTGTTSGAFASILTNRNLPYRAGEGGVVKLTGRFNTGVASSTQLAGLTSTTDSLAFAMAGVDFGIIRRHHGVEEIQELQVTSATTGAGDVTVTVDGTPHTIAVTVDTVQVNALEIATALNAVPGLNYQFTANDDTVTALDLVAKANGSFAFALDTATGTAATWTQIAMGDLSQFEFVAQANWNRGLSFTVDPTKGNVFKVQYQYLGYGNIDFFVENKETGQFELAHVIEYANTNTEPSLGDPNMRGGWSVSSQGSTTDITLRGASCEVGIQGKDLITNDGDALTNTVLGVTTTLTNLITFRNRIVRGERRNLADTRLLDVSGLTDSNKGAIIVVIQDATVAGNPDFQYLDKDKSTTEFDVTGTTVTGGILRDVIALPPLGGNSKDLTNRKIINVPNGEITLAGQVVSGAASDITAVGVFVEDI